MAFRVHSTRDRKSHRMGKGEGRAKGMRVFPLDQKLRRQFCKWGGGSQDLNIFNLNIYSLAWALFITNGITCHSSLVCRVRLSRTTDMSKKLCAFVQWYFPGHVGIQVWGEPGRERFPKRLVGCRYAAGTFLDAESTFCVEECPLPAFPSVHLFTRRHTGTGRTHHRSRLEQWYWWRWLECLRTITKSVCSSYPECICAAAHKTTRLFHQSLGLTHQQWLWLIQPYDLSLVQYINLGITKCELNMSYNQLVNMK